LEELGDFGIDRRGAGQLYREAFERLWFGDVGQLDEAEFGW
jgi:hypothetical protein